jgi:hypothetical protein
MAKGTDPFEMSEAAKQAMSQVYGAMDGYFDNLKKTIASAPSGGTEFGEKLKSYAERNTAATHDFMKKLSQAKDLQDMFRIQAEFLQAQVQAFGEQTTGLAESFTKAAGDFKLPMKPGF